MRNILAMLKAFGIEVQWLRARVRIPLATLEQWLAGRFPRAAFALTAQTPGIHIRGRIPAVGARILCAARLDIGGLAIGADTRTLEIRIGAPELDVGEGSVGPLVEAIRKGRIDLARPADLVGNQLGLPPLVTRASGDTVALDFARLPALREGRARRRFMLGSALLGISRIEAADGILVVQLRLFPAGLGGFCKAVVRHALIPALDRMSAAPAEARA